jgi:glycopeptide antibiotics resistance protein
MIYFFPISFLIGIVLLITILAILKLRGKQIVYLILFSLTWIYLLFVIGLTLFPIPLPVDGNGVSNQERIVFVIHQINLIPFRYLSWFSLKSLLFEMGMNVVLTVPFGFLINIFSKINWRNILWISIASGLVIETSQLIMSLFFGAYRTVDISDVILNASGTLLGFLFYKISKIIIRKVDYSDHFKWISKGK